MKAVLRLFLLWVALLAFMGCAGGRPSGWGHFHADPANQGYQAIDSGFALSSSWISEPYKISSASPVIGLDFQNREVLYICTTDAKLVAVLTENGRQKWERWLGSADFETAIVASASVSDKGNIYVIATGHNSGGIWSSTLYKINQFGKLQWAYLFPDHGFTTGSPKAVMLQKGTVVFVYQFVSRGGDIHGELFAISDDGDRARLLDRRSLATGDDGLPGRGCRSAEVLKDYEKIWNVVGTFSVDLDLKGRALPNGFIDPTVALVAVKGKLLIAVVDNLCGLGVFEWNGEQLSVLWHVRQNFEKHSSPAVFSGRLMVFGQENGKVMAYDVLTGVKMWQYDAGRPVFATPAGSSEKLIFVVSGDSIQALNTTDGTLVHDGSTARKLPLKAATYASPAVTSNRVYVSSTEMMTLTHDFKTRSHDTNFHGSRLASPAVGRDGAVYAVAADGTVRKYAGTR